MLSGRSSVAERLSRGDSIAVAFGSLTPAVSQGAGTVFSPVAPSVFETELLCEPTAVARMVVAAVGPWYLRVSATRWFTGSCVVLGCVTTVVYLAELSALLPVVAVLLACWSIVLLLLPGVYDSTLVHLVSRSFDTVFLLFTASAFCAFSVSARRQTTSANALGGDTWLTFLYAYTICCLAFVDAAIPRVFRSPRTQLLLAGVLVLVGTVNLIVSRVTGDRKYDLSDVELCVPYCASLRTLALNMQTHTVIFLLRLVVAIARRRTCSVQVPVRREIEVGAQQQRLVADIPHLLSAHNPSVLRWFIEPTAAVPGSDNKAVVVATMPRVPVVAWPRVARVRRHPVYTLFAFTNLVLFTVADVNMWTRDPAVAVPMLCTLCVACVCELTALDANMMQLVVREFQWWYIVGCSFGYIVVSVYARSHLASSDTGWSIVTHAAYFAAGMVWTSCADAMSRSRWVRAGVTLGQVVSAVTWLAIEAAGGSLRRLRSDETVCVITCASLSSLALSLLSNLLVFVLKMFVATCWSPHLALVRISPRLVVSSGAVEPSEEFELVAL